MEEHLDAAAELRRMGVGLAGLSEPQREVLELIALDELSHAEVAQALGLSQVTVRARLVRARRKLRHHHEDPSALSDAVSEV